MIITWILPALLVQCSCLSVQEPPAVPLQRLGSHVLAPLVTAERGCVLLASSDDDPNEDRRFDPPPVRKDREPRGPAYDPDGRHSRYGPHGRDPHDEVHPGYPDR